MKQRILRTLFIVSGCIILINGVAVMTQYIDAGVLLTVCLGLLLMVPAIFIKTSKKLFSYFIVKLLAAFVCVILISVFINSCFLFVFGNSNTADYKEDYIIVLGCGLKGDKPSMPLVQRLDAALDYIKKNDKCQIIVSGGQGSNELCSEAEAMSFYLTNAGVNPNRIIIEDKSTSTYENLRFTDALIPEGLANVSAVFVTNDYHIYRANTMACVQGYNMNHIGAKTIYYNILPSYLREQLAIMKAFALGFLC